MAHLWRLPFGQSLSLPPHVPGSPISAACLPLGMSNSVLTGDVMYRLPLVRPLTARSAGPAQAHAPARKGQAPREGASQGCRGRLSQEPPSCLHTAQGLSDLAATRQPEISLGFCWPRWDVPIHPLSSSEATRVPPKCPGAHPTRCARCIRLLPWVADRALGQADTRAGGGASASVTLSTWDGSRSCLKAVSRHGEGEDVRFPYEELEP